MKKYRTAPRPAKTHASDSRGPLSSGLPPRSTLMEIASASSLYEESRMQRASEEAVRKAAADERWMLAHHG